ncbi:MAG: hypothetical protein ACYC5M_09110 [Anaerolineae bacterium]
MSVRHSFPIRSVYLYAVSLITLVMIIFATVNLVRSAVELAYPEPRTLLARPEPEGGLDAEELERQQEFQVQWSRRQSVLGLAGSVAMLLVAGPLYLYHWRKIQREAGSAGSPEADG